MKRTRLSAIVSVVGASALLAACSAGNDAAGAEVDGPLVIDGETVADEALFSDAVSDGVLRLYTTYSPDGMEAVNRAFTEDTGIEVEQLRLTSPKMYERVVTEHGAGELSADVIDSTDPYLMEEMAVAGIFAAHEPPSYDSLTDYAIHEGHQYYTTNLVLFSLVYNSAIISPEEAPESWADLLDPRWEGQIGLGDTATGTGWSIQLMLYEYFGEEYWRELAALDPILVDSIIPQISELARGEVSISLNHIGTALQEKANGAPLDVRFFPEAIVGAPHSTGLVAEAGNAAAAEVYLNWRLSERGAQVMADTNGDFVPRSEVEPPTIADISIPAQDSMSVFTPDVEDWTVRKEELAAVWKDAFGR